MYAIFKSGGKQYQAKTGSVVKLEKLAGRVGDKVTLDEVMLLAEGEQFQVGSPTLPGVTVQGRIVQQGLGPKIIIFKHKRRKDYRKKQGHRQPFTAVFVERIGKPAAEETQPADSSAQE
ncbi:MAG: 50S ribosomal protein L21 [Deltaproteobacteria bacterium]|nr:50S ribosomal protein L21 [Deltaproteobacteria bacterium]